MALLAGAAATCPGPPAPARRHLDRRRSLSPAARPAPARQTRTVMLCRPPSPMLVPRPFRVAAVPDERARLCETIEDQLVRADLVLDDRRYLVWERRWCARSSGPRHGPPTWRPGPATSWAWVPGVPRTVSPALHRLPAWRTGLRPGRGSSALLLCHYAGWTAELPLPCAPPSTASWYSPRGRRGSLCACASPPCPP